MALVGKFKFGDETVKLHVNQEYGASVALDGDQAAIWVGSGQGTYDWGVVLSSLLHEAGELYMIRRQLRYAPADMTSTSTSRFTFIMHHEQWSDMCDVLGKFVEACSPKLKAKLGLK